jgi:hypothetical protein
MKIHRFYLTRYVRLGSLPMFLVFYHNRRGRFGHSVMLCNFKTLRTLIRDARKGFSDPADYGRVLYQSHANEPDDLLKDILKARYDFDLNLDQSSQDLRF